MNTGAMFICLKILNRKGHDTDICTLRYYSSAQFPCFPQFFSMLGRYVGFESKTAMLVQQSGLLPPRYPMHCNQHRHNEPPHLGQETP